MSDENKKFIDEISDDKNREKWLLIATSKLRNGLFKQHGADVPPVKLSVGIPSRSKRAIGQHWIPAASDDKLGSVFISPVLDDALEVLAVLVHELVHASVKVTGHGPAFKKLALKVGLEGKMRSTTAGPELIKYLKKMLEELTPYPHKKLNMKHDPVKKQTTRNLKMQCSECGYISRSSKSFIELFGPVICPCNNEPMELSE